MKQTKFINFVDYEILRTYRNRQKTVFVVLSFNVIVSAFILCCVYSSFSVLQESMSSAGTPCNPHMKTSVSNSLSEDSCGCVFVPQEGEGMPTICDPAL